MRGVRVCGGVVRVCVCGGVVRVYVWCVCVCAWCVCVVWCVPYSSSVDCALVDLMMLRTMHRLTRN